MLRAISISIMLATLSYATLAQAQNSVEPPGRQVVESDDYLAEVIYSSRSVRVRIFDLEGEAIDLSGLWLKRCAVGIEAWAGGGHKSRQAKVHLVVPENGHLPYLEARHQLGSLGTQDRVEVSVRVKNLEGRGDRTDRFKASWERVNELLRFCTPGAQCRRVSTPERECSLCRHRLCRPR